MQEVRRKTGHKQLQQAAHASPPQCFVVESVAPGFSGPEIDLTDSMSRSVYSAGEFPSGKSWQQLDHAALLAAIAWAGVLARGNLSMQRFAEETTLSKIEVPVLVLSGKHDRMTLPAARSHMEDWLRAYLPFQVSSGTSGSGECP